MRWWRAVGFGGLVGLTLLVGGCSGEGSGVAGPVPGETTPATPDGSPAGGPAPTGNAAETGGR